MSVPLDVIRLRSAVAIGRTRQRGRFDWTTRVVRQSVSTLLRPVLIVLHFHRLFLFCRLLFLALVLIFLAAFVSHWVILSCCPSSFE
jgi:hypothetical protein